MEKLPKEFVLMGLTKEQSIEVLKYHGFDIKLGCQWSYLLIGADWYNVTDDTTLVCEFKYYKDLPKLSYQEWKELVHKKKFDYTKSSEDIFYKIVYPLFSKEFLFGTSLEEFLTLVNETFILNDIQVEIITQHWIDKENILS